MLAYDPLDLPSRHVFAPPTHTVLLAAHEIDVAVFVVAAEVSSVEPAIAQSRLRGFGVTEVTPYDQTRFLLTNHYLPGRVGTERLSVIVSDVYLKVGKRFANGTHLPIGVDGDDAGRLRHAVALADLHAVAPLELPPHLRGAAPSPSDSYRVIS